MASRVPEGGSLASSKAQTPDEDVKRETLPEIGSPIRIPQTGVEVQQELALLHKASSVIFQCSLDGVYLTKYSITLPPPSNYKLFTITTRNNYNPKPDNIVLYLRCGVPLATFKLLHSSFFNGYKKLEVLFPTLPNKGIVCYDHKNKRSVLTISDETGTEVLCMPENDVGIRKSKFEITSKGEKIGDFEYRTTHFEERDVTLNFPQSMPIDQKIYLIASIYFLDVQDHMSSCS